jgi:hypothetical protein
MNGKLIERAAGIKPSIFADFTVSGKLASIVGLLVDGREHR